MITSRKYRAFYKYLEARYADVVVLTFGQIEDLLGSALPAAARLDPGWWTNAPEDAAGARCSDAWTLAHRTAKPNIVARHVVFERMHEVGPRS